MTILNMTYCVRCGKHHATTKGCNVDDVRKHKKEMEKYRAKGKLVEDPNDVTQKDIDDILRNDEKCSECYREGSIGIYDEKINEWEYVQCYKCHGAGSIKKVI